MKKKFLKVTSFALAVILAFAGMYFVFDFKYLDSVFKMDMFYKQEENTVDVLVLGSSHAYQGVNTAVLWKEYGIAAYDLCGAAQPIYNSYYYLEEALKTQTPKAIILDLYTLHYDTDYSETSFAIKNTYGLKWSKTKIEAIKASFDSEQWGNQYFFSILQYHSRYNDLNKIDFYPYQANKAMYENHKGFYCYFYTKEINEADLSEVNYANIPTDKNVYYLNKIIELAESKNIPLIFIAIPFEAENYHEGFFNYAKVIAKAGNIPFYDFLTDYKDAVNIDYKTDFSDSQHLNYKGNTKLTRFLGEMLKENYNIPDNRGNEKYSSWEKDAQVYYNQLENHDTSQLTYFQAYTAAFSNERYKIIVTSSGYSKEELTNQQENRIDMFFKSIGISEEEYTAGGVWLFENGEKVYYNDCSKSSFSKAVELSRFDDAYIKPVEKQLDDGSAVITNGIFVNKEEQTKVRKGINVYIYDTFTQSTVDSVGYNFETGKLVQ